MPGFCSLYFFWGGGGGGGGDALLFFIVTEFRDTQGDRERERVERQRRQTGRQRVEESLKEIKIVSELMQVSHKLPTTPEIPGPQKYPWYLKLF